MFGFSAQHLLSGAKVFFLHAPRVLLSSRASPFNALGAAGGSRTKHLSETIVRGRADRDANIILIESDNDKTNLKEKLEWGYYASLSHTWC